MRSLLTALFVLTVLSTAAGKTVDYTGRNLTQVPTDAFTPDAHTVRLSHNRISRLGSGFTSAPRVRYLIINDNRVNTLSPQSFQPLQELLFLDLDRNRLVSLRDFTFSALAALSDLILSNNLISAVSVRAFHGLTSLEFLELSGNRLSAVPVQAVRLIPGERLLLVLLMVNNISHIPGDIASLHPSASYKFHGNPLRCPDEKQNSSREDVINAENIRRPSSPVVWTYVVDTLEGGRRLSGNLLFIKDLHKYFGVAPKTFYVSEHLSVHLPEIPVDRFVDYPTAWITPTGRRPVPAGKALTIEDFTAEDSGNSPSDDVSPEDRKNSTNDICAGSPANQSCSCFNGSRSPSFHHPKFCDAGSTNSDLKPTRLLIILGIASMMLCSVAVFCWRKRQGRSGENGGSAGAAVRAGAQAMAVCIPLHPLPRLTELSTEGEPNASLLSHLRGTESRAAMKMGATQYTSGLHRATGARPAEPIGTTEAQIHHYENADADEYASVAPRPLPDDEETAADAVNTSVPEGVSEQPAFQIGDGLEMPYGVAAANAMYQRGGTAPNPNASVLTNEHTSSTDLTDSAAYTAIHDNPVEAQTHIATEANIPLYRRDTAPNRRSLTSEHAHSGNDATLYCATDDNGKGTVTAGLYGQQID
ncbi:PREDICTED: uncharacterized protein LOC109476166 [Branchiostoma belcheri]|uniref:Uncharacterized protein LOC109476166 n=1 Tax=Branchiostoma belcheri TaxID=7741 RepID=A0A6P4ZFA1_BRABE|nr:PREDICTED: uncharacterized protein LOC109476166 [Branchiostoma belcheri]